MSHPRRSIYTLKDIVAPVASAHAGVSNSVATSQTQGIKLASNKSGRCGIIRKIPKTTTHNPGLPHVLCLLAHYYAVPSLQGTIPL